MSVSGAITRLAGLRMTGVTSHFSVNSLPGRLTASQLPALILTFDNTYADALKPLGVNLSGEALRLYMQHILLVKHSSVGVRAQRFSTFPGHFDNYMSLFDDEWLLNNNLRAPLFVEAISIGEVDWEGDLYIGAIFRVGLDV